MSGCLVTVARGSHALKPSLGSMQFNHMVSLHAPCGVQIEPVTSGHRITLTYELRAKVSNAASKPANDPGMLRVTQAAAAGSRLFAALKAALDDPSFLPDGVSLCTAL